MKSPWARASICSAGNGRVEVPVEGAQRQCFAEVGILDEAFDAALAAQAGLIGEQAVQELQVRAAAVFGVAQGGVELVGGHRDAQGGEVGEDLLTQARGRGRCRRVRLVVFLADGVSSRGFLG